MEPEGSLPHSQALATCPYPRWRLLRDASSRNPPPGDPSGGVVYRIVLSPGETSRMCFVT
jgi:hypothetical protein